MTVPVPEGIRDVDVLGFSAGSYTGLAIHEVLNEFDCFRGTTKVAAIASPPEMLRLATGERRVVLLHCLEDRLCVWRPDTLTDLSYNIVLIDGHPSWSGRARHAYGHLLFTPIEEGTYHIDYLQITTPEVIPHGMLSRSLYRSHVLSTFFGPVLGAMMKQVCWHSRRSEAHRGLPEARPRTQNVMAESI